MKRLFYINLFILTVLMMTSCQLVDVVFNTGALSGVILITVLAAIVVYILAKVLGKRRKSVDSTED